VAYAYHPVDSIGAKWNKVFRGSYSARIDDKGRLKIPNAFRALVEGEHGASGLYITSLSGDSVRMYPMSFWLAVEQRLARMPSTHPARLKFLDRVNYYGQVGEFDVQGRVLIPARLRDSAGMSGDVDVVGAMEYLEVWNHERLVAKMQREAFTDDDARALAEFGI
jgi:MraZ protein